MVVPLVDAKRHLNITENDDDTLLSGKIAAAESHISRLLGFSVEAGEDGSWSDGKAPADIREAILQLVAHWYENREATAVGVSVNHVPFSVQEIVREHRNWSFG